MTNNRLLACLAVVLLVAVLLGGCGDSDPAPTLADANRISLSAFPDGIGRGFAAAKIDGPVKQGFMPKPGEDAPEFTFVLDNGHFVSLADLKGRPILINFWATWCPPCRSEMPELVKAAAAHPELVVLAVDLEEARSQIEPFAEQFKMSLPIIRDAEGKVHDLYAVRGLPTTFFIGRDGKVQGVHSGQLTPQLLQQELAKIL